MDATRPAADQTAQALSADVTRRDFAVRLGAGGLAALLLAAGQRPTALAAQDSTPAALPPPLDELLAAWNGHDSRRLAALYAEDAVVEEMILGSPVHRGPEEVAAWAEVQFAGLPDLRFEVGRAFAAGDRLVLEWVYIGTYTGQFPGLPPGAGQAVSVPGVTVFELEGGRIVRETLYYDSYTFLVQTGVAPPPGTPAAGTPAP